MLAHFQTSAYAVTVAADIKFVATCGKMQAEKSMLPRTAYGDAGLAYNAHKTAKQAQAVSDQCTKGYVWYIESGTCITCCPFLMLYYAL